jgi:hypothetical protein
LGLVEIVPVAEELIRSDPIKLPCFGPRLATLDFGWDHPSAAVDTASATRWKAPASHARPIQVGGPQHARRQCEVSRRLVSVEAGIMDMLDRMKSGRLRVFSTLTAWFEEFRLYHRSTARWSSCRTF